MFGIDFFFSLIQVCVCEGIYKNGRLSVPSLSVFPRKKTSLMFNDVENMVVSKRSGKLVFLAPRVYVRYEFGTHKRHFNDFLFFHFDRKAILVGNNSSNRTGTGNRHE